MSPPFRGFALALGLLLAVGAGAAETPLVLPQDGDAASLATWWRTEIGDDPAWADPAFDDSSWRTVRVPLPAQPAMRTLHSVPAIAFTRTEMRR